MIAVLAENHLAYRGKLSDMCNFLGVTSQTTNTKKIKTAIAELEKDGEIKVIKDGYTWTLTLSSKAESKRYIIEIQAAWIDTIKNYKCPSETATEWTNILKVLLFLITDHTEVKRYASIGKQLKISTNNVKNAVLALDNIKLPQGLFERKLAWKKIDNDSFKIIGQRFQVEYSWI